MFAQEFITARREGRGLRVKPQGAGLRVEHRLEGLSVEPREEGLRVEHLWEGLRVKLRGGGQCSGSSPLGEGQVLLRDSGRWRNAEQNYKRVWSIPLWPSWPSSSFVAWARPCWIWWGCSRRPETCSRPAPAPQYWSSRCQTQLW